MTEIESTIKLGHCTCKPRLAVAQYNPLRITQLDRSTDRATDRAIGCAISLCMNRGEARAELLCHHLSVIAFGRRNWTRSFEGADGAGASATDSRQLRSCALEHWKTHLK